MRPRTARAGFTLLEILAVLLIVSILAGVLITNLLGAEDAARTSTTRAFLAELQGQIEEYERELGRYPASTFTAEQGVANDGTNVGVEALVVALFSGGWNNGGHEIDGDRFGNTDGDSSSRTLTDFGNKNLLELLDEWENPIAYLHRSDYGRDGLAYLTLDAEGMEVRSEARAFRDPQRSQFFRNTSFQLISAGPDGTFGTEDDVTPFDRD